MSSGLSRLPLRIPSRDRLPLALLAVMILALFYRLLLGDVLFWGLPSLQFYPWREFAMHEFAAGRWPLWNPYNGAGVPLLANYQSALLYPPHLLYWLWSGPQMMGILGILHVAWAGLGMWLLTGRLNLSPLGRGIATLAYPLSTPLIARFGTFPMLDVAAWLPWLILVVDRLLDRVTIGRLLALAGVVAMDLLAGHAQWTFYSFLLAGAYALWRLAAERSNRQTWITGAVGALIAILLGTGIAGAQLLPTAELQRESQRASGVDESFALNFSYAPLSLLTWLNPNFFGNPGDGSYVINGAYFETTAYVGVLPVILAILGTGHYFLRRRKHPLDHPRAYLIPFLALVTGIALLFAFGRYTPLYPLLYRAVPTFNLFQAPARWLLLAVFCMPLAAGFAASTWVPDWPHRGRIRLALAGSISLFAAGILIQLLLRNSSPFTLQLARGITVLGALLMAVSLVFLTQPRVEERRARWAASVLIFVAVDLWWANAQSNPTVPASFYDKQPAASASRVFWPDPQNQALPDVAFTDYLRLNDYQVAVSRQADYRRSNLPNLNLLDRQPSLNDFDPLRPDGLDRFTRLMNASPRPSLQQAASVGVVYGETGAVKDAARVWMVATVGKVTDANSAEQIVVDPIWNPYEVVTLEGNAFNNAYTISQQPGSAHITAETPQDLTIAVESPGGGILVVADTYYPGWIATLDGSPVPIYRANLAFRGIEMPPGNHTVTMRYQPQSFAVGLIVSVGSLVVWGLLLAVAIIRRRGSQPA